jgi:hypothetical protein
MLLISLQKSVKYWLNKRIREEFLRSKKIRSTQSHFRSYFVPLSPLSALPSGPEPSGRQDIGSIGAKLDFYISKDIFQKNFKTEIV